MTEINLLARWQRLWTGNFWSVFSLNASHTRKKQLQSSPSWSTLTQLLPRIRRTVMKSPARSVAIASVSIASTVFFSVSPALAATPTGGSSTSPHSSTPSGGGVVRAASVSTACTGGATYRGSGSASLTNGTLAASVCRFSPGGVATVNIQYVKTGGSAVTVRFAWEWVDRTGSNPTGRRYDQGSFSISSGQTRGFQWTYASPGVYAPSGNAPCVRGVLTQGSNVYSTRIIC